MPPRRTLTLLGHNLGISRFEGPDSTCGPFGVIEATLNPIVGKEKLTDWFGYWPSFHDAEIHSLHLFRDSRGSGFGPTVEAVIHVFEMTKDVNPKGFFVQTKHTLVTLRFFDADDLAIDGLNNQNAILGLNLSEEFRQGGRQVWRVELEPAYGLGGSFTCSHIEVVEATPYVPPTRTTA